MWTQPNYSTLWGYYGYGWTTVYVFSGAREETKLVVETLVHSVPRNALLWAGVSTTTNPKGAQKFIAELGRRNRERNEERAPRKMTIRVLAFTCAALIAGAGNLHAQPADQTPAGSGLPVSILSRLDMTLASLDLADGDEPAERTERSRPISKRSTGPPRAGPAKAVRREASAGPCSSRR